MSRCCVIIPTYGEAPNLAALVPEVFAQQAHIADELWVLVVEDDSPDHTRALLEEQMAHYPRLRVLHGPKLGLGVAYQRGFHYAGETLRAERMVQMDGDWQHDPQALPALVEACRQPFAAVIGSRFAPGGTTPSFSRWRRGLSLAGNGLLHHYTGLPPLSDYTSGFRCWEAATALACLSRLEAGKLARRGYAFQSSLLAELLWSGGRVLEFPIQFGVRRHGRSKLTAQDGWEFWRNLEALRRRGRARNSVARAGARLQ